MAYKSSLMRPLRVAAVIVLFLAGLGLGGIPVRQTEASSPALSVPSFDLQRAINFNVPDVRDVAVFDMDGDTHLDIITVSSNGAGLIYLQRSNSAATPEFEAPVPFTRPGEFSGSDSSRGPWSIAVGYLDDDTIPDIIVGVKGGQNRAYLLTNVRPFTLKRVLPFGDAHSPTTNVEAGYAADKHILYVAVGNESQGIEVYVYRNGSLTKSFENAVSNITTIAVGQVDALFGPDIVVGNSNAKNKIYLARSNDTFNTFASQDIANKTYPTTSVAIYTYPQESPYASIIVIGNTYPSSNQDLPAVIRYRVNKNDNPNGFPSVIIETKKELNKTSGLAADDFNNDGRPDVVVGRLGQPITIYHGTTLSSPNTSGDPDFLAARALDGESTLSGRTESTRINALAFGDLDGDMFRDLVLAGPGSLQIAVNRPREFLRPLQIGCSENSPTRHVAVADIDGDKKPDMVQANEGTQSCVLRNNIQDGVIGDSQSMFDIVPFGRNNSPTTDVAVANIDGNNGRDLVVAAGADSGVYLESATGALSYNNSADIQFSDPSNSIISVAAGVSSDNGTSDDLIVAGRDNKSTLIFMYAPGNNPLQPYDLKDGASMAWSVAVGNVVDRPDATGIDVVVGRYGAASTIFLGDGTQALTNTRVVNLVPGQQTRSVAVANLYGDQTPEIVVGNDGQPDVIYALNGSSHTISPTVTFDPSLAPTRSVAVGDLDNDHDNDIVTGNYTDHPNEIFIKQADGTFAAGRALEIDQGGLPVDDPTNSVALGDINNDGALDIVVGNDGTPSKMYLNAAGTFAFESTPLLASDIGVPNATAVGDMDGDGRLDVVVGSYFDQSAVLYNKLPTPGNVFSSDLVNPEAFGPSGNSVTSVVLADVDRENGLDIIVGNDAGPNIIYYNNGQGQFPNTYVLDTYPGLTAGTVVGDVDNDNDLDILVGNLLQSSILYLNAGNGTFIPSTTPFPPPVQPTLNGNVMQLDDIDGDHLSDIVISTDSGIDMYQNIGGGYFAGIPVTIPLPSNATVLDIAAADFVEGGGLEVAVAYDIGVSIYIYNANTDAFDPWQQVGPQLDLNDPNLNNFLMPWDIKFGDMNGDGDLDLIYTGLTTNIVGDPPNVIVMPIFETHSAVYLQRDDKTFALQSPKGACAEAPPAYIRCFGEARDDLIDVDVADMDGDSDLDFIASYVKTPAPTHILYFNDGSGALAPPRSFLTDDPFFSDPRMVIADFSNDGHQDLVLVDDYGKGALFPGTNAAQPINFSDGREFIVDGEPRDIAVGDLNGDRLLDIVVADNFLDAQHETAFYINNGSSFAPGQVLGFAQDATSLSVDIGDVNGDEHLDIIVSYYGGQSLIYLNDSSGTGQFDVTSPPTNPSSDGICSTLPANIRCFGGLGDLASSITVVDVNGDGAVDIVAAYRGQPGVVYLNDGRGNFYANSNGVDCADLPDTALCFGDSLDHDIAVAAGDLNGDGRVDIAAGSLYGPNRLYLAREDGSFVHRTSPAERIDCFAPEEGVHCFGQDGDAIFQMALADMDTDGDLDIVTGNQDNRKNIIYVNDGQANFAATRLFDQAGYTFGLALGDLNDDGASDIVTSQTRYSSDNTRTDILLTLNSLPGTHDLPNQPPKITIDPPQCPPLGEPCVISESFVDLNFTLADDEGDPVHSVTAYYSLDGGGRWTPALGDIIANTGVVTTNLEPGSYIYRWNTSDFFGQSDNVVFRLVAYPGPQRNIVGPYQRSYIAAQTVAFRARGAQIQVIQPVESTPPVLPLKAYLPLVCNKVCAEFSALPDFRAVGDQGAIVYRISVIDGQEQIGTRLEDGAGRPFRTNASGYLQGRGVITETDRLVALLPVAESGKITLYYTNGKPGDDRFDVAHEVDLSPNNPTRIQRIEVKPDNALILLNLEVVLEWDIRADDEFLTRLTADLRRASALLYDWTNGQAALGDITIRDDKQGWESADIRIYASNLVRPNSTVGGIADPSGQIRIGPVWNRFGDRTGNLGDDWARALAHEVGHYAFYLNDNYLGLDQNGVLAEANDCLGAMTDPYSEERSEFRSRLDWLPECENTLSNRISGLSDWETIDTIYPWLNSPPWPYPDGTISLSGPNRLLLDITRITPNIERDSDDQLLNPPLFFVEPQALGDQAQAFLFKGGALSAGGPSATTEIVDLGQPIQGQVLARGAVPGDRLCVFALTTPDPRLGCIDNTQQGNIRLPIQPVADWQPEVIITPGSSVTEGTQEILPINVTVAAPNLSSSSKVKARVFTADGDATLVRPMVWEDGKFTAEFRPPKSLAGYVHIWIEGDAREVVTSYGLNGSPAKLASSVDAFAPVLSPDGQVIIYGRDLHFDAGQYYAFQPTTRIPTPPSWATPVGQAYRLTKSPSAPDLSTASLSFSYLGRQVPAGEEEGMRIYYYNPEQPCSQIGANPWANCWEMLGTIQNLNLNVASAQLRGPGIYALMSSIPIPLPNTGWNTFGYSSRETRPVAEALGSIEGKYELVATLQGETWLTYDPDDPAAATLTMLEAGHGYQINVNESGLTLLLRGGAPVGAMTSTADTSPGGSDTSMQATPPAVYRGIVVGTADFTPAADMPVIARIDGRVCGRGRTFAGDGGIKYIVALGSDTPHEGGCAAPGRTVHFEIGSKLMATTAIWDNRRPIHLNL